MASPDERQGDRHATCYCYTCDQVPVLLPDNSQNAVLGSVEVTSKISVTLPVRGIAVGQIQEKTTVQPRIAVHEIPARDGSI
jgi:hypothetical protein